jgi:glycosyltransferase involved in cell wall biosynthesis
LILSQYFWPESFLINDLALGLRQLGHAITVLTGQPNYPGGHFYPGYSAWHGEDDFEGIRVARVPLVSRGASRGMRLVANYLSFALSASILGPWKCRESFDAVIVFQPSPITVGLPAVRLKALRGLPILFWVQDLWPETLAATGAVRSPLLLRQVDVLVRYIYRRCDSILVQSRAFADYIAQQGVAPHKIRYMPNWAENVFQPAPLAPGSPEDRELPRGFRILFAGNIGVSQSFPTILNAAERLRRRKDIHWIVIGDGREKEWVQREITVRELDCSVHLLGRRAASAMPGYFAASDALLVTLKSNAAFARTIPSKVQSYLACGRPILGSLDGEGAAVIEEARAGLVCRSEQSEELARLAVSMANLSPQRRREMGQCGRKYYEQHFDRQLLLKRWDALVHEVTEDRSKCAA